MIDTIFSYAYYFSHFISVTAQRAVTNIAPWTCVLGKMHQTAERQRITIRMTLANTIDLHIAYLLIVRFFITTFAVDNLQTLSQQSHNTMYTTKLELL